MLGAIASDGAIDGMSDKKRILGKRYECSF